MPAKKAPKVRKQKEVLELAPPKSEVRFKPFGFKLTEKQVDYINQILDPNNKVIFICGEAGCSKTFLAVFAALKMLKNENVDGIMYIRAAVESASRSLGFMPHGLDEKLSFYLFPLQEKMEELLIPSDKIDLLKRGKVEGGAINFLRGRSIRDKAIILDEANQLTINELETVITRLGDNSKLILCGDFRQKDIKSSGYKQVVDLFDDEESRVNGFKVLKFTSDDIVRSEAVKFAVKKFESL